MLLNISWNSFTTNKSIEIMTRIPNIKDFAVKLNESFVSKCELSENDLIRKLVLD